MDIICDFYLSFRPSGRILKPLKISRFARNDKVFKCFFAGLKPCATLHKNVKISIVTSN